MLQPLNPLETKWCRPAEAINYIDRAKETDRMYGYAIEHLMFTHPYKKFDLKVEGAYNSSFACFDSIHVYDFEQLVCKISLYNPAGEERTNTQLQFEYNYNVHKKDPKSIKRTCNTAKILDCVKLIKAATPANHKYFAQNAKEVIEEATRFSAHKRSLESVFSNVAYANVDSNLELFDDLFNGRDTVAVNTLRTKFLERRKEFEESKEYRDRLRKYSVMVVKNHNGDYRVVHRRVVKKENSNDMVAQYFMSTHEKKEDLHPAIFGKLCLLEIAQQSIEPSNYKNQKPSQGVEGVGTVTVVENKVPVYIIVGEDLEDPQVTIDANSGTESQD